MAKISIDEKCYGNDPSTRKMMQLIFEGTFAALERLNQAAETIEVIKITPHEKGQCDTLFINVKVVILSIDPYGPREQGQTRLESSFDMVCRENASEFISQRIVRTFQETTVELANRLDKNAANLRIILATLGMREQQSGNNLRCKICGHIPTEKEKGKPCAECAKWDCSR